MSDSRCNTAAVVGQRLRVRGQVQGVGFRPHVGSLATSHTLTGRVLSDSDGVTIEVEGALLSRGLQVLAHARVPCNDGGLSLGQAVICAARNL